MSLPQYFHLTVAQWHPFLQVHEDLVTSEKETEMESADSTSVQKV